MSHMVNKIKTMNMPLPDAFIVQLVFKSILKDFLTFHVTQNTQPENRNVEKLFTMCSQKQDRLKAANGGELVFHVQQKNKNYQNNKKLLPPSTNHKENGFSKEAQQNVQRNLIRVSRLDDDFVDCHFGDGKCEIQFNKECVGLAFRQDKLYLFSVPKNMIVVCFENKNSSSYENVIKKRKRIDAISSKLWHCHLGHISRGRIECLVKASILSP